ncbi:hypothetical protein BTHE68_52560 [Burkholderia sp. THE68]|uniref:hypothetical protein n=1 Tax=Burkholderiaceae TaxID=119060 RepID=UPI0013170824|nr:MULTISPECIES: hypothetical protein [Burkholderiaceae]BBU31522.1 hypothetical protein BTHE68_52560 [Burkholderia sp. THE68]BCQ29868.1 hypothetical protein NK8_80590 [Caballeronia sp. NK8]
MVTRWIFSLAVYTLFAAALAQYADQALTALASGSINVWNMGAAGMEEAGAVKYVKDASIAVIGVCWPLALGMSRFPYGTRTLVLLFFAWILCVISVGLVPFIAGSTPLFFLAAGLRWVLLVHASFGLFLFARWLPDGARGQTLFVAALLALGAFDFYVAVRQWMLLGQGQTASFAGDRYTGLLSNAALAGMYAISLACMALILDRARLVIRLMLLAVAVAIAVSSGTRFAMISIAPVAAVMIWEMLDGRLNRNGRMLLVISALPIAACLMLGGYTHMVDAVGRGDVLANQLDEGGRLYNLGNIATQLADANAEELLLGRGLGVGTNTAFTMLERSGVDPEQYRFNQLIDNAFVTMQFQIGALGMFIFMTGALAFLWRICPHHSRNLFARYLVFLGITIGACMDINLWEQYPLVTTLFLCFGDTYWRSVSMTSNPFSRHLVRSDHAGIHRAV